MRCKCEKRGRFLIQEFDSEEEKIKDNCTFKNNKLIKHRSSNSHIFKITHNICQDLFLFNLKDDIVCEIYLDENRKFKNFDSIWENLVKNKKNIQNEFQEKLIFKFPPIIRRVSSLTTLDSSNDLLRDYNNLEEMID